MRKKRHLAILATLLVINGASAFAHSWYDPYCCNTKDCQPIPKAAVKVTAKGYIVTLAPHEHPMLAKETAPHTYLIPFDIVRESKDDDFHACIYPGPETMRCFYAPPVGS
ncbi:MAG TPA: hypothetical protein VIU82_25990 [Bosea sp. (in: a-proteobacteria)]